MIGGITRVNKRIGTFKDVFINRFYKISSIGCNYGYVRDYYIRRTRCNYDLQERYFKTNKEDFSHSKQISLEDTKSIVAQISLFFV